MQAGVIQRLAEALLGFRTALEQAVQQALLRLDSIRNDIMDSKFSFEDAKITISSQYLK